MEKSLTLFYAYAPTDEALRADLEKHLTLLQKQKLLASWHSEMILAGQELQAEREQHWREAFIILLLISPDFLASCEYALIEHSLSRHRTGTAWVVPILLRPVDWQGAPFDNLAVLPSNKQPVTLWKNRDEAFAQIAQGIRSVVEKLQEQRFPTAWLQTEASTQKEKASSFFETPPLTDARTIQQRERLVKALYAQLSKPDLSALAITGLRGTGKSTLAALLYKHAESQRQAGQGLFTDPAIWINVAESTTFLELAEKIFTAINDTQSYFASLSPQQGAEVLYQTLSMATKPRLIVLNQFDYLLEKQSGRVLANRPGLGEWLDLLNRQPIRHRLLLTSRIWPKGKSEEVSTCIQEYIDHGLEVAEGIQMLRQQEVTERQASDEDLQAFVTQTAGHALALTLLAAIFHRNPHLTLRDLVPRLTPSTDRHTIVLPYHQLWEQDMAHRLLNYLYHQLNGVQRQLLRAFAIYREPVPLEATWELIEHATPLQVLRAFEVLRSHHLLLDAGEKCYQLHAIVAHYVQQRFYETQTRSKIQMAQTAHLAAIGYYRRLPIPPRPQRLHARDISPLVEICWHLGQAGQWQEAYRLLLQESLINDLRRWGEHARILELCALFLSQKTWGATEAERAAVHKHMGRAYSDLGNLEQASEAYTQALFLFQHASDRNGVGVTLNHLGRLAHASGKQAEALTYHRKALNLFEELGDRGGQGTTLNNMGACHQQLGELEQARQCYGQALQCFQAVEYMPGQARTLNDLGRISQKEGRKEDALEFFAQALHLYQAAGDQRGAGWSLYNLGLLAGEMGQNEQAWHYFVQAALVRRLVNHREGEALALYHLAKLALSQAVDKRALVFLLYTQHLFQQLNHPELFTLQKDLARCEQRLGTTTFTALSQEVESQVAELVEQMLRSDEHPL